jgi:ribonuclease P protein component
MSERRGGMRRSRPRLTRSADFDRVYRHGRSAAVRSFVLYAFPSESADPEEGDEQRERVRLGVSVGRRVGGAVERNRVKRVLREAFWLLVDELPPDYDFVIVARGGAAERAERDGLDGVKDDLQELLGQLELKATAREGK